MGMLPGGDPPLDDPVRLLEAIRQMRMAALYPKREALAEWIETARGLLSHLPDGPLWQLGVGYLDGMIAVYDRRFGKDTASGRSPDVPFRNAE